MSQVSIKKNKTLVLLDAHAILHRAYHALPPLTSPDGMPTGALYGFASMLLKIIRDLKPDYIAAAYDLKAPTFRHIAYKAYKGTRAKTDDELIAQFNASRDILQAFHIPAYDKEGFEADDIIGTIVEKTKKEKNLSVIIASGDLDTLQLVENKKVQVYTLRKGIQDTLLYDEKAVQERFGFGPLLLVDFKGLKGDASDNIKGIEGIGEKTATDLISRFGSLETILSLAKKNPKKLKNAGVKDRIIGLLQEQKEQALFSKELASIKRDVPISFSLRDAAYREGLSENVISLFKKFGFTSILARMQGAQKRDEGENNDTAIPPFNDRVKKILLSSKELYWISFDKKIFIITDSQKIYSIGEDEIEKYSESFQRLFKQNIIHRAFDAKTLLHIFDRAGISPSFADDLQILFWLKDPRRTDPSLEIMLTTLVPTEARSLSSRFSFLPHIFRELLSDIERMNLLSVYKDIEMPLIPVLFSMESEGIGIDTALLRNLKTRAEKEIQKLEKDIYAEAGETFLINSPKELSRILFDVLGISSKGIKKTGTGKRSTRFSELTKLKGAHPIVEQIIVYREIGKLYSTYISTLPELAGKDGRIHTTFHQTGTVTGRLSSSDPNMQNIPARSVLADEIRRAFIPREGSVFLVCDYSQIQLRIAALLSREEKMLSIFEKGEDIHTATASEVFNVSEKDVTPEMRRRAKVINFGILYGMGAHALAVNLEVSRDEASLFLDKYFQEYPQLFAYFEKVKEEARAKGYVQTIFGRKRFLPDIHSGLLYIQKEAERMAMNMPIQGSEADMMKKAMEKIFSFIEKTKALQGSIKMILQIHDELLFEVKKETLQEASALIPPVLENIYPNEYVDFPVETKIGPNWADLKKVQIPKLK